MNIIFAIPIYNVDTRANQIERWTLQPSGVGSRVCLSTSKDVAEHVASILIHRGMRVVSLPVTDPAEQKEWTHCLETDRRIGEEDVTAIDILTKVLLLRAQPGVASAIALDWYKDPTTNEDPRKWSYTMDGQLVHDGKYRGIRSQATALCDRLADIVTGHPIYRECTILTVPGSSPTHRFSETLAASVANRTGQSLITTKARTRERPEAKSGATINLRGEFIVNEGAAGRRLLMIDDLYHSGGTMEAIADAARKVGALEVHGLVGARTMRR